MTYLIRATTAHRPSDYLPALRYWNATLRQWDDYTAATRYDHENPDRPKGPRVRSIVDVVAAHPVDVQGFPYLRDTIIGPVRLTHCCAAITSIDDGPFYCKSCYVQTSPGYEMLAVIDPATLAPPTFDIDDARDTSTPFAAYGTADQHCVRYGPRYFSTDDNARQYAARQADRNDRAQVFVWDLNRADGTWTLR